MSSTERHTVAAVTFEPTWSSATCSCGAVVGATWHDGLARAFQDHRAAAGARRSNLGRSMMSHRGNPGGARA